jgi:hypothetical protein
MFAQYRVAPRSNCTGRITPLPPRVQAVVNRRQGNLRQRPPGAPENLFRRRMIQLLRRTSYTCRRCGVKRKPRAFNRSLNRSCDLPDGFIEGHRLDPKPGRQF